MLQHIRLFNSANQVSSGKSLLSEDISFLNIPINHLIKLTFIFISSFLPDFIQVYTVFNVFLLKKKIFSEYRQTTELPFTFL